MTYKLLKDGEAVNTIVGSTAFVSAYAEAMGYTFEEVPGPVDMDVLKTERVATTKANLATYLVANPLTWIDGNKYTVTADKQSLLTSQLALYQTAMAAGQPYELKWNPTGGECSVWEYENLVALALAIGQYVQPLVSYQQAKEVEIMGAESVEALEAIVVDYDAVASAV